MHVKYMPIEAEVKSADDDELSPHREWVKIGEVSVQRRTSDYSFVVKKVVPASLYHFQVSAVGQSGEAVFAESIGAKTQGQKVSGESLFG